MVVINRMDCIVTGRKHMENSINITGNFNKSINFAMQQNYVPVIRDLVFHNDSGEVLTDLEVTITFEPEFANVFTYHIDEIQGGQSVELSPVRIKMKTEYLFSLTEKIVGTITVAVSKDKETLQSIEEEIEILAYDQWSGILFMPEIIAAFLTPNHPIISSIITDGAGLLKKWSDYPSFTGYQTKSPQNVKLQMAALYHALQMRGIIYNNPPASYERIGQRVRLPHMVLEQKQGTCLDLAILYATCLEAVGLHSLLVITEKHAFTGCWLEEETFADCMVDDVSALEKRTASGSEEILLVECTDYVAGKNIVFDQAVNHGKSNLDGKEEFRCVIDIQRSRASGIRPIPVQIERALQNSEAIPQEYEKEPVDNYAPKELDQSMAGIVKEGKGEPLTKQKIWERKLLDFSLRNTLLNFRPVKGAFQLMTFDLSQLEDSLSDGTDFRILEIPSEWIGTLRDVKLFEEEMDQNVIQNIAAEEFKSNRLRSFLDEATLEMRLKTLYRSARMSLEENGSNTLFLAMGFLKWYESDLSEKERYAPIVLVPVDIVKNIRGKGYLLRSRQEESQMNITLLEYLKQDHGLVIAGLDPLPQDEHGIDLQLVFHIIRQAIMAKKRWNIEETAYVGLFSFGQFVMWNDLRNRSKELKENKVVSSLMEGGMNWEPATDMVTPKALDEKIAPKDMAVPVSADSSQLAAIKAAAEGQSFVLHGPPGTGKSQTITNMIANALYQGKSVLFVAEKMAALNVVEKRLSDIGLGPFCLELHSNKANKTSILSALDKTLEVGRIKSPERYEETADQIHELRNKLNFIMEALHKPQEYGCSLYEALEQVERNRTEQGNISFDRQGLLQVDKEKIVSWDQLVRQYGIAVAELGMYQSHPLKGYEGTTYSLELREQFQSDLEHILKQYEEVTAHGRKLAKWAGFENLTSRKEVENLLHFVEVCSMDGVALESLAGQENYDGMVERLNHLVQIGEDYNQISKELLEQFEPSVFDYQVDQAELRWKQTEQSWFLPKWMGQRKLLKELSLYAKTQTKVSKDNITAFYQRLGLLGGRKKEILESTVELTSQLSSLYFGTTTDWNAVRLALDKTDAFRNACNSFALEQRKKILDRAGKFQIDREVQEHKQAIAKYIEDMDRIKKTYGVCLEQQELESNWLETTHDLFLKYHENVNALRDKVTFNQIDRQLCECGLEAVTKAYKEGMVNDQNLNASYVANLYYELALITIQREKCLSDFNGKQYNDVVEQYKEYITKYQKLTIQELVARLSAKVPVSGANSASTSEMGILKKAIKSNGRMLSIRRLFEQIPNLLRRLCPCMLMSPISVAQYIDPAFPKFDLVIFDEASQLPTSEAVGTIARGENVVIVGDPKQLPPTNFFSKNRIDEDNNEKEDLESLLDDCLAISMPQESLKWHYRSRHESLIAYSNMKYYDNKLYTFPSPRDLVSEVKMIHLDGFYDKGKTKYNKAEAKAIVDEIVRRLKDEDLRKDSIGVVTFSSVQQNLIDDMLSEELRNYPELEEYDQNSSEPIFIKNLENVQGDERDVILFSIGYGPDATGKVSMNFGPLNRDGGWRRLNVAISRARKSMIVYSVLRPEQIDLSRTRSEGVAGLKGFLEFAEKGKNVIATQAGQKSVEKDYLVEEIAAEIREMGYDAKCNIGCSQYKMDIGIVDKKNPDTYILGIVLDGKNLKKAATTRDRFVLQPGVLKGLGWNLMRIWTLDWLDDRERVKNEIKQTLDSIPLKQQSTKEEIQPLKEQVVFEKVKAADVMKNMTASYVSATIPIRGVSEDYYAERTQEQIKEVIAMIVEQEAPISKKLLMRKVLSAWNISRGGARVENIFNAALKQMKVKLTKDQEAAFVWKESQDPQHYSIYRVEDAFGNKRTMDDVPSQEILNGVSEVLNEQVSLTMDDLVRETAKKFGYSRLGKVIQNAVGYAILQGINRGTLRKMENGNVVLVDEE